MDETIQMVGKMSFKFDGATSIDAELLTKSLSHVVRAYKDCITAQYGDDAEISIDVCAFREGSFDVVLQSIVGLAPLAIQHVPQIVECTKNFIEIIKIKRELKGLKPKSVDVENGKTRIVNAEGDVAYHSCNVYNLYVNNPSIDGSLSNVFGTLADSTRPAISFKAEGKAPSTVTISEDSYSEMKVPIVDELLPADLQRVESLVTENLLLKSPDFLGDSKWGFHYDGKTIHASIEDGNFKQRVRSGKVKLSAGVRIPARMKIEVYMNEKLEIQRRNYTIVEVLGDVIEPSETDDEQQSLFE